MPDFRLPELTALMYAGVPSPIAKWVSVPSSTNSPYTNNLQPSTRLKNCVN